MKKLFSILFLIFVFTVVAQTVNAQGFPYHLYAPRTMAELTELNSVTEKTQTIGKTQISISAKPFYSAVRVDYAGKSRKLSERKLAFYKIWATALNVGSANTNDKVLDVIQKEYLFKECDKEYWIPVQKQVAAYFPKELKSGDKITLYLMAVGGVKPKDMWEFVFLTNEFKKY